MKVATKFLNIPFTIVATKDAGNDVLIEGYANTKTKDRVGDVVLPVAFEKSLPTYLENPVLLENHDWGKVAGVTLSAKTDDNGLFIRAKISATRTDLKTQILEGCLRMFSIGYNELQSDFDEETKTKIVKELELLEISIVSVPANPEAKFSVVGAAKPDEDEEDEDKAGGGEDDPDKGKPSRAGEDAAASAEPGKQKAGALQECVSDKIPKLIDEGYERDQAIAIAFSMCGEGKSCSECGTVKRPKVTRGKLLTFIAAVKNALEVDELDDSTVVACCNYANSNEELMTKKELIEALRKKSAAAAAPAAPAAGAKADPADSDKPAGANPAESEEPAPDAADGGDATDAADALKQILAKLDQMADALAQLLENDKDEAAEGDDDDSDDDKDADAEEDSKDDKPAGQSGDDGQGDKPAEDGEDAEKSAAELEKEIAEIEAELESLGA